MSPARSPLSGFTSGAGVSAPRRISAASVSLSVSLPVKVITCWSAGHSPRTLITRSLILSLGTKQTSAPQSLRMYAHSASCCDSYIGT